MFCGDVLTARFLGEIIKNKKKNKKTPHRLDLDGKSLGKEN